MFTLLFSYSDQTSSHFIPLKSATLQEAIAEVLLIAAEDAAIDPEPTDSDGFRCYPTYEIIQGEIVDVDTTEVYAKEKELREAAEKERKAKARLARQKLKENRANKKVDPEWEEFQRLREKFK